MLLSCEIHVLGGRGIPGSFCSNGTKHADTTLLYESPYVTSEVALVQRECKHQHSKIQYGATKKVSMLIWREQMLHNDEPYLYQNQSVIAQDNLTEYFLQRKELNIVYVIWSLCAQKKPCFEHFIEWRRENCYSLNKQPAEPCHLPLAAVNSRRLLLHPSGRLPRAPQQRASCILCHAQHLQ